MWVLSRDYIVCSGLRSEKDITAIKKIMSSIKEFGDYPTDIQMKICQYVRYER